MPAASLKLNGLSRRSLFLSSLSALQHNFEVVLLAGIEFRRSGNGPSRFRFLRIHGNEETARQALEQIRPPGETFIVTSPTRLITLQGGRIDPNRLFSRQGAARSFQSLNPNWSPSQLTQALDALDQSRPQLLEALLPAPPHSFGLQVGVTRHRIPPPHPLQSPRASEGPTPTILIALHNNGPGYSVETERPLSQAEHLPSPNTPHEFFLCTTERDFHALQKGPYNAVLQSNATGEDDGSLSRLCAARRLRYINLEAAHGQLETQKQMLEWLLKALP